MSSRFGNRSDTIELFYFLLNFTLSFFQGKPTYFFDEYINTQIQLRDLRNDTVYTAFFRAFKSNLAWASPLCQFETGNRLILTHVAMRQMRPKLVLSRPYLSYMFRASKYLWISSKVLLSFVCTRSLNVVNSTQVEARLDPFISQKTAHKYAF